MVKLIIENELGLQEIISIKESGQYFDSSKVIFDERVDGKLSQDIEQKVGGLKRQGKDFSFDLKKFSDQQKFLKDKQDEEKAKQDQVNASIAKIKEHQGGGNLSLAQLNALIDSIVEVLQKKI